MGRGHDEKPLEEMSLKEIAQEEIAVQGALNLQSKILHKLGRSEEAEEVSKRVPRASLFIADQKKEVRIEALEIQIKTLNRLGKSEETKELEAKLEELRKEK